MRKSLLIINILITKFFHHTFPNQPPQIECFTYFIKTVIKKSAVIFKRRQTLKDKIQKGFIKALFYKKLATIKNIEL